jgi:alanine racemase
VVVEIHTLDGARELAAAILPRPLEVWLKLNSGMNRLGMLPATFIEAHRLLEDSGNVTRLVSMSHFASAEDLGSEATRQQITLMSRISAEVKASAISMANSAGIIAHAASHAQWIRPGIMLYGDNPLGWDHPAMLRPVMQLKSRVIALHDVPAGGAVGYHATWRAETPRRIAAVGIGYGDGYPRSLPNGTPVLIHGQRAPLCGRVSMDIISIDVSDLNEPVRIGDEVLLWGDALPPGEIATLAGTISYELFTGVAPRVPRIYRDD